MNSLLRKTLVPVFAIATLLLMVAWMAGMFSKKMDAGMAAVVPVNDADLVLVEAQLLPIYETVPASVEAKQATRLSSRILARIDRVHVRAGDTVEKGQLLVELEQADLQSRLSRANAAMESVSARLVEAKASLARAEDLTERGLLAQSDLDIARANHDSLVADLSSARQASSEASTALDYARVLAPISGRIVDRFAEPGDTAQPGMPLLSLYNPSSLRIEARVREQLAISLTVGQSLEVVIQALDKTLQSQIEEIVPAGDTGSRSFLIKSRLQQSADLLPGLYAELLIPAGERVLLLAPVDRVATVGQLDIVWVLNDGVVERRLVRTGKPYPDDKVEIISGLEEGESLLPL
jgi:RND family efflux transporter MFP subunit